MSKKYENVEDIPEEIVDAFRDGYSFGKIDTIVDLLVRFQGAHKHTQVKNLFNKIVRERTISNADLYKLLECNFCSGDEDD